MAASFEKSSFETSAPRPSPGEHRTVTKERKDRRELSPSERSHAAAIYR